MCRIMTREEELLMMISLEAETSNEGCGVVVVVVINGDGL